MSPTAAALWPRFLTFLRRDGQGRVVDAAGDPPIPDVARLFDQLVSESCASGVMPTDEIVKAEPKAGELWEFVGKHPAQIAAKLPLGRPYDTWTERDRRTGNMAAIYTLRQLEADKREATEDERQLLRAWSGWGGINLSRVPRDPRVLTPEYLEAFAAWDRLAAGDLSEISEEATLLTGVVNQFFTPVWLVRAMWQLALRAQSYDPLHALEPSAGSGRFVEETPPSVQGDLKWTIVELDELGSTVLRQLYPDQELYTGVPFEAVAMGADAVDRAWDLVISNPPYPTRGVAASSLDYAYAGYSTAHAYFTIRSFALVKPGGILVTLTPLGQIHSETGRPKPEMAHLRREMLRRGRLRGAFALPADVFPGAHLPLVVHVWQKLPTEAFGVPSHVGGMTAEDFVRGEWFRGTTGNQSVMGRWEKDKRFNRQIVVGPHDGTLLGQMPLLPGITEEELQMAQTESAQRFSGVQEPITPVTALHEEAATLTRRKAIEAARAAAEVEVGDNYVVRRAHNLAARLQRWVGLSQSDPEIASLARGELARDIESFLAAGHNPHTDARMSNDRALAPLLSVILEDGTVHHELLVNAAVQRHVSGNLQTVTDVIVAYASRYGVCEDLDVVRHGFDPPDAVQATIASDTLGLEPATDGGYRYVVLASYLSGHLWPKLDKLRAALQVPGLDDALHAKLQAVHDRVYRAIRPATLAEVAPTPRSPFIPIDVLTAFANYFVYDWCPRAGVQTKGPRHVFLPRIAVLAQDGAYRFYPARRLRQRLLLGEDKVLSRWLDLEHPIAVPETHDPAADSEAGILRLGWDVNEWKFQDDAGKKPGPAGTGFAMRWEPVDLLKAPVQDWMATVPIIGPPVFEGKYGGLFPHKGHYTADSYSRWTGYDILVDEARNGWKWYRSIIEDRAFMLLGYLNQESMVDPLLGTDRTSRRSINSMANRANGEQLTEQSVTEAFDAWVRATPDVEARLLETYNRMFRGRLPPSVSDAPLRIVRHTHAGKAPPRSPRPFQVQGIRRIATQGSALVTYEVGLGKTITGALGIAAARQSGTWSRGIVVAPNSVAANWMREVTDALPDYQVEVVGFHRRNGMWFPDTMEARIAKWLAHSRGLLDMLIVPYSKFEEDVALSDDATVNCLRQLGVAQRLGGKSVEQERLLRHRIQVMQDAWLALIAVLGLPGEMAQDHEAAMTWLSGQPDIDPAQVAKARNITILLADYHGQLAAIKQPKEGTKGIYTILQRLEWVRTLKPFRARRKYKSWKPTAKLPELLDVAEAIGVGLPPMDTLSPAAQRELVLAALAEQSPAEGATIVVEPLLLWDSLSIDGMVVDEGHNYKNLFAPIEQDSIAFLGAPSGNVTRAWDMWFKCQDVLRRHDDQGIVLLTATPLKNSPLEIYNLLWLLSYRLWAGVKIGTPDMFIDRYLDIDPDAITVDMASSIGTRPALRDFKEETLGELRDILATVEERRTLDDLRRDYAARGELSKFNESFPTRVDRDVVCTTDSIQEAILVPLRSYLASELAIQGDQIVSMADRYAQRRTLMEEQAEKDLLTPLQAALWAIEQEDQGAAMLLVLDIVSKASLDPRLLTDSMEAVEKTVPKAIARHKAAVKVALEAGFRLGDLANLQPTPKKDREKADENGKSGLGQRVSMMQMPAKVRAVARAKLAAIASMRQLEVLTAMGADGFVEAYKRLKSHAPKILAVAKAVASKQDCGHVIFCDYNLIHDYIIQAAQAMGVRKGAIITMTGDVAAPSRQALAEAFNRGEYVAIIGNTRVMGEGLNLQEQTCTLHHVDFPWEPASMIQREGRAVRQGNKLGSVVVAKYITPGSADTLRLNAIQGKKGWQDRFRDPDVLTVDNAEMAEGNTVTREDLLVAMVYYRDTPEDQRKRAILKAWIDREKAVQLQIQRGRKVRRALSRILTAGEAIGSELRAAKPTGLLPSLREEVTEAAAMLRKFRVDEETVVLLETTCGAGKGVIADVTPSGRLDVLTTGMWIVLRMVEGGRYPLPSTWSAYEPTRVSDAQRAIMETWQPHALLIEEIYQGRGTVKLGVRGLGRIHHHEVWLNGAREASVQVDIMGGTRFASCGLNMLHDVYPEAPDVTEVLKADVAAMPNDSEAARYGWWRERISPCAWASPVVRDMLYPALALTRLETEGSRATYLTTVPLLLPSRPDQIVLVNLLWFQLLMHTIGAVPGSLEWTGNTYRGSGAGLFRYVGLSKAPPFLAKVLADAFGVDKGVWAYLMGKVNLPLELVADLRGGELVPDTVEGRRRVQQAFHADKIRILCVGGVPGRDETWAGEEWPRAEVVCIPSTVLQTKTSAPAIASQTRAEAMALVLAAGMDAWFDHWAYTLPTWAPGSGSMDKGSKPPIPSNAEWMGGRTLPRAVAEDLRRRRGRDAHRASLEDVGSGDAGLGDVRLGDAE